MLYNGIIVAPVIMHGKVTKYVVDNEGHVFNTITGHQLKWKTDSKGYYTVTLSENGIHQDKRVHVLVALGFVNNPQPDRFKIVNHLDGNKKNPKYTNLEWTDHSGNVRHAIENGLMHFKNEENASNAILTNEQVHKICKMMEDGNLSQREISKIMGIKEYLVREIKLGNNWKTISCHYKIENCKLDIKKNLNEEIVRYICKEFENNILTVKEISNKYNVPYDSVLGVLRHGYYSYISKDYDFSKYDKTQPAYSKDLKIKVLKLMNEGYSNSEIISECDLTPSQKTNVFLHRMRKCVI